MGFLDNEPTKEEIEASSEYVRIKFVHDRRGEALLSFQAELDRLMGMLAVAEFAVIAKKFYEEAENSDEAKVSVDLDAIQLLKDRIKLHIEAARTEAYLVAHQEEVDAAVAAAEALYASTEQQAILHAEALEALEESGEIARIKSIARTNAAAIVTQQVIDEARKQQVVLIAAEQGLTPEELQRRVDAWNKTTEGARSKAVLRKMAQQKQ